MADENRQGGDKEPSGNNWMKSLAIWAAILLGLVIFVQLMGGGATQRGDAIRYSEFLTKVEDGSVREVIIGKEEITGRLTNNQTFRTNAPPQDTQLISRLREINWVESPRLGWIRVDGMDESLAEVRASMEELP